MAEAQGTARGEALHGTLRTLMVRDDQLYGVVDSARDARLASFVFTQYMDERRWLFEDQAAEHMRDVAPYLVPIAFRERYPYRRSEYLDLWAERLGTSAGIMLLSGADAGPLQRHLRRIFQVGDEEGNRFFFRFYDPRVLRVYLPTCTPAGARQFCGPIRKIVVESEEPGGLLVCTASRGGVRIEDAPA